MGSGGGSGRAVAGCLAKSILILTNVLFFLVGAALIAVGVVVKFAARYVQPYVDQATAQLPTIASSADLSSNSTSSSGVTININEFFGDFYLIFIGVGIFVAIVGILGMCGACCTSRFMLVTYALIVFVLIIGEFAVITILVLGVLDNNIKAVFRVSIEQKYVGLDSFDRDSLLLNMIMLQFQCCGVDSYADFNASTSWLNTRTFNYTSGGGGAFTVTRQLLTPIACCRMDAPFPAGKPTDNQCMFSPNASNSNYDKGCYTEVANFVMNNYKWPAVGAASGVLVFEFLLAVMAAVIAVSKPDSDKICKVEPM